MPDRAVGTGRAGSIRQQRALETRRRVVKAAYQLFCRRGFAATTMNQIAAEAGVAVQTLYFTFGTKGAILGEALGAAVVGFDEWTPPPADPPADGEALTDLLPWHDELHAAEEPRRALNVFVENGTAILSRVGPLFAAMLAAAADPETAAVMDLAERRRVESYRHVAATLARTGGLRSGVDEDRATDVLLVLFSAEVYQALSAGRGWPHEECQRFFADVLSQQLLAPDRRPPPAQP